jgi:CRP-like cAMP-binding protein
MDSGVHPLTLRSSEFGLGLPESALDALGRIAQEVSRRAGVILCHEGDASHGFFLLLSGELGLSMTTPRKRLSLGVVGPGQVLGLSSMLNEFPIPATATAVCECRLLLFRKQAFLPLLPHHPELWLPVSRVLSDEVRRAYACRALGPPRSR